MLMVGCTTSNKYPLLHRPQIEIGIAVKNTISRFCVEWSLIGDLCLSRGVSSPTELLDLVDSPCAKLCKRGFLRGCL
jgi:hypothetical protein